MLSKLVSPKVTNSGRPFQLATQARGRLKCSVPDTDPSPALTTPIQSIPNPRVRPTHILRQPARPLGEKKETILVQIEEDHQDVDQFEYVQQKGNWQGHNIYLKQLLVNKNYAHAFDYWKTLRNFGPTPDTLTYNTYFALVEVAGSPYDIIDTFYDFDEHNILRVQAQPDATSFAFLIKAHCTLRNLPAALDVLQRMADLGITPVQRSFAMILDLCADQALFEEGRVVLERVKAEIFENESVNQNVDIEVMNSVMFFLGSHTITEGEKYFHSIIRAGIQMSYNTYQRLIELYLKANRPQDIARIVHLMKNDGFTPNAELTKYTLMEAFIETGDKAILNSITSTYPKPTFQREQHYKFFYDFISKYIAGGGPVYIPEGFLDIATPDELEQLYVQVIAQEVGVIPHVGEQLDSYGRTTVDLNELLSEDDIDDQLEPQEEENDINEIMEDKKHSLQLDIDDEDSHFERLEEEIWSGKPSRRDDESSYSYDYGSDNYSEQVTDEAAAKELTILPSGKNYMEDSDHQDYDMTNEDESRDSDEEERRSSGEGGSSDIGVEPEELWAESSQQNSKRASGSSSSARARSVLDAPGEEGEGKSDGGGSQQLEVMQQAAAQEKGDEVSDGTRQAALEGGAEFEEDFDDLLDFGEGGDGGGPDGRPIDDVEEEPSEGAEDSRSRPWRRRKAKAPHMPKLEDSDPFDAENDFHRDEPDARYLEILRQLEVSPAEFAARKEKEQVQEWLELDEMSDENPDVFQRGVYPEALVQQSTELYNILEEEDIKEVAQAINESQEDDSDSDATGPHASPKDVIKSEWEHAVTESGQSTPDAVFGSEQYEYQSAVESLQAVESDYVRRKAALDQKREAEGGAKKKTAKATTTSGNTDDSAPQQDVSESSSEGEFAYDRESVSDEAEATPSALDRVFTADYLFPAKLTKQTPREAKEFRQRFEAVPGYDPIAQQIDDNSIGGIMANPGRIDKMAKPSIKEPTESEIDKAHVRRMYLTKIKKRYEEAKAKGASKVELNKIREVFNQVKKTRVTQEEVDDFDSKMELYEHHLKHENPKKYKELYAMYLMDTKRDSSGFDDPVLSAETGHHPMEVMEAQMSAIDDFYVDAEMPHDDNVFIDAVRQFDHRNPEDPDMKRLVLRWGKNVQEMNNTDLDQAYQRTRMASINVLMPNQPQRKWTGNPDDIMWNLGDDSDDHNYL